MLRAPLPLPAAAGPRPKSARGESGAGILGARCHASPDHETSLGELARRVVPDVADWCIIDLLDQGGGVCRVELAHVDPHTERRGREAARRDHQGGDAEAQWAAMIGQASPRLIADLEPGGPGPSFLDQLPGCASVLKELGVRSLMIAPLLVSGRSSGAITFLAAESGRRFSPADLQVAQDLAARAATLVDKPRLLSRAVPRHGGGEPRGTREQFKAILDGIGDGITVQDRSGRLTYANQAVADGLGYATAAELVAASPRALLGRFEMFGEEGERLTVADLPGARAVAGEPGSERLIRYRLDGNVEDRWVIARSRPLHGWDTSTGHAVNIFTDITALKAAERERADLLARAGADPLTGLANHRVFHERLAGEVSRARRYGEPLALVLIDVDHFKQINDSMGHLVGDRLLVEVADRLREVARSEDVLARIGGDEFALLLPHTGEVEAYAAVERARRAVALGHAVDGLRVSLSAGICDLATAHDADSIFRFADGALYWSKAHGRDVAWIYDPAIIRQLSAQERAEHLQQSQTLIGIRALARAIDAKDPSTRQHSERVAALAARLAGVLDWGFDRVALLNEAALVHDVGKLGVPDAVLLKPGPLTELEYAQLKLHPVFSAQIVEDVLRPEQVAWIRAHHERPDGSGYPDGITELPGGAALLTLADAWDVMTVSRAYSPRKDVEQALEECQALVGHQFTAEVVEALEQLYRRGVLSSPSSGLTQT